MNQTICSFAGCEKKKRARGLCSGHYGSARRAGKIPARQTPEGRFWAKVDKTEACWNWTAGRDRDGYGKFHLNRDRSAHSVAFELTRGPVAGGRVVDHTCHNKACVRPDHLRLVTTKQNAENRAGAQSNSASGVRGVSWDKRTRKWKGTVRTNGKSVHVGLFSDLTEAGDAVTAKRLEILTHSDGR